MSSRKEKSRERERVISSLARSKGWLEEVINVEFWWVGWKEGEVGGDVGGVGKSCSIPREWSEGRGLLICYSRKVSLAMLYRRDLIGAKCARIIGYSHRKPRQSTGTSPTSAVPVG